MPTKKKTPESAAAHGVLVPTLDERRGRPRFLLQLPVMLKVYQDREGEIHGTTENVSLTGILVITDTKIPLDTHVELTMALIQPATPPYKLRLSNTGKVVRVERRPAGRVIAIECDRAFAEVTTTRTF